MHLQQLDLSNSRLVGDTPRTSVGFVRGNRASGCRFRQALCGQGY